MLALGHQANVDVMPGHDILSFCQIRDQTVRSLKYITHMSGIYISLSHWGRVTHICISELIIIGSDNGLSPERRQAIIWTIAGILLIGTLGTNFSQILREIDTFSFKKMHLKMSSAKWRQFCLHLNVLFYSGPAMHTRMCYTEVNESFGISQAK